MEIVTKFLSIVRIQGTPDAKTIFEAVNKRGAELGLPTEKIICVTTDGASVMRGCRNSVTRYRHGMMWHLSSTVLSIRKF